MEGKLTLAEIKRAVDAGKTVHWTNKLYTVEKWGDDHYAIVCSYHDSAIGLTWKDGKTMNGRPSEFYIAGTRRNRSR